MKTDLYLDPNLINMVDYVADQEDGDRVLDTLAQGVIEGFKTDWTSRAGWIEDNERWLDLIQQVVVHKTFPWPGAANIKFPLLLMAALQYQARIYPLIVNGTNVVRCRVVGEDPTGNKLAQATRVALHMNWQLLEQMEEWEDEQDLTLMVQGLLGTCFKKTYFDPNLGRVHSIMVNPVDLVINYSAGSVEQAQRVTHVLYKTKQDVQENIDLGLYADIYDQEVTSPTPAPMSSLEVNKDRKDRRVGITAPTKIDDTAMLPILEQHTFADIDGDGYAEPVIITVDYLGGKVLRIVPRFEISDIKYSTLKGKEDKIVKITPDTSYFTKYGFIPNPESRVYDLGLGKLAGPLNHAIDTLLNQLVDAGTLSNLQSGFLGRGIGLPKGRKGLQPGEWLQVSSTGDDLTKSVVPLPAKDPSNVLFQLLGMLIDVGKQLTFTVDLLQGESPGQNQPAVTTMVMVEQGLQAFSSIVRRTHRALRKEVKTLYKLNGKYLDEVEYFSVLDPEAKEGGEVGRADYDSSTNAVVPYSDPSIVSASQELMKTQVLQGFVQQGTVNAQEATRRTLEAMKIPDIEALMTMPPAQESEKITLKRMELDFESKKFMAEAILKNKSITAEAAKDEAVAILAMAKAESEEVNRQIKELQSKLAPLMKLVETAAKRSDNFDVAPTQQSEPAPQVPEEEAIGAQDTEMAPTSAVMGTETGGTM